jgi:small-conductance mechanosensitive channel
VPRIPSAAQARPRATSGGSAMNNIIYIVGLVVVVLAILSFLGLR